ncbi:86_t:CDS:2, partial [Funneliformis geosporum]
SWKTAYHPMMTAYHWRSSSKYNRKYFCAYFCQIANYCFFLATRNSSKREATISTYMDEAKSIAKVHTEILNSIIDSMSTFRQPLDLEKDDIKVIQSQSMSATGNGEL